MGKNSGIFLMHVCFLCAIYMRILYLYLFFLTISKQAQRCYCETPSCTGWIGEDPDKQVDDDKRKERKKKKRDEYLDVNFCFSFCY